MWNDMTRHVQSETKDILKNLKEIDNQIKKICGGIKDPKIIKPEGYHIKVIRNARKNKTS